VNPLADDIEEEVDATVLSNNISGGKTILPPNPNAPATATMNKI
jgi:hypothetical protein